MSDPSTLQKPGRSRRKRREVPVVAQAPEAVASVPVGKPQESPKLPVAIGLAALVAGIVCYWPTIALLVDAWNTKTDYSHGYLVAPLAVLLLWLRGGGPARLTNAIEKLPLVGWTVSLRRDVFPGYGAPDLLLGSGLLAVAVAMRIASAWIFIETIDAWSILVWLGAVTALLFGRRILWWSLPAIGFLFFMIPLPFSAEQGLSLQLQGIATKLSCWSLQLLGQPALAEGHIIRLGDHPLEVAQACSGLSLFVSILAVAYYYLVAVPRAWWERVILVVAALPIAIGTNAMRIVATGLLYQFASSEAAQKFTHDMAGFVMIPVAAAIFGMLLWYLTMLFPWEEELDVSSVVKQASL